MEKPDWLGKSYYSLNAYLKHTYGQKCYKIAVDAGFTCPNRDGTKNHRGCIFCSQGGSGDFAVPYSQLSVNEQIARGLSRFNKESGDRFIIYFQAFTNTYGNIEYLEKIYTEALENPRVVGISIATRPDCLGLEQKDESPILKLLAGLQERYEPQGKFLWVELGLQTIHEKTANYIRRHYPLSVYDEAIKRLSELKIPYITHIILGLPGETEEMMLETVRYVDGGNPHGLHPFGIKLQLLHVLKNTDLAKDYEAGQFSVLELEEYLDLVVKCLQNISEDVVIHRVTGDGPKSLLLAPLWSGDKKRVLNGLHQKMREQSVRQGDLRTDF